MSKYDFQAIEQKWQAYWAQNATFRALGPGDEGFDASRPKFFVLDMFPYPSGAGLHVGHPLGYIGTDIVARYKRMTGHNVLHPMGFDAFGLPAEQYAIETGVHPRDTTRKNIANMLRQLKAFGLSYDWDRELATIEPDYYRWTQWIFLQIWGSWYDEEQDKARPVAELEQALEAGEYLVGEDGDLVSAGSEGARTWQSLDESEKREFIDGRRLAFISGVPVNWCPGLGTVLANEEVTNDGRSERGNFPVFKRPLRQWQLRITAFAERLIRDLDDLDWPEPVKLMQRNWVGRSRGASVEFRVAGSDEAIRVFTTRPDTLFGATYMVLAPEHPLVETVTVPDQRQAVSTYQAEAGARSDVDRQADSRTKTGVFTGAFAINPTTGEEIPIWIADYVMMGYGTGAIMAVPCHDSRDFEFAKTFSLPIVPVIAPDPKWLAQQAEAIKLEEDPLECYLADPTVFPEAFCGQGTSINSANREVSLNDLSTAKAQQRIISWLEQKGLGFAQVQYKLRDWLFSRQRYWGEPFPVLHGPDGRIQPVPESELPVVLPEMEDFRPSASDDPEAEPKPSLGRAPEEWRLVEVEGQRWERELNTMPQWAGSCWYYLRFIDPHNSERFVDREKEHYWMGAGGVDLYVGGVEHAVLHLLYARFWHKLLYDLGHVSTSEPFRRLFNQGYIQAYAFQDARGVYVPASEVVEEDGSFYHNGQKLTRSYGKMGKSLKNAVAPDEMFAEYGCDTLRLYEMYMGPLETSKPWITRDIVGVSRFLQRVWRNFFDKEDGSLLVSEEAASGEIRRLLHATIKQVTHDMETLSFNTSIARLIELNNALVGLDSLPREVAEPFVLMLAPLVPHLAEELWQQLGFTESLAYAPWPDFDERYLVKEEVEIAIQIMGKMRGTVCVAPDAVEDDVREAALAEEKFRRHLDGKTIRKVIFVPGRLLNIIAN